MHQGVINSTVGDSDLDVYAEVVALPELQTPRVVSLTAHSPLELLQDGEGEDGAEKGSRKKRTPAAKGAKKKPAAPRSAGRVWHRKRQAKEEGQCRPWEEQERRFEDDQNDNKERSQVEARQLEV